MTRALAEPTGLPARDCATCGHEDHGDTACGEMVADGARAGRNCPCGWGRPPAETTDQWAERAIREHVADHGTTYDLATTRLLAAFARQMVMANGSALVERNVKECIRALVAAEERLRAEGLS